MTDKARTLPMTDQNEADEFVETVIACCNGQMGIDAAREVISELHLAGFAIVPDEARTSPETETEFAKDCDLLTYLNGKAIHPDGRVRLDISFDELKQLRSAVAAGHAQTPDLDDLRANALILLAAEDERQAKLHELLETIREQIRLEVSPEHRPETLFHNIQNAVYAMRGRTLLLNDAAITAALAQGPDTSTVRQMNEESK